MKNIIIGTLLLVAIGLNAVQAGSSKAKPDAVRGPEIAGLKWGMFICWSMSSAINSPSEYVRVPVEPKQFNATGCDTDQWCQTAKEAGMGYILFLTKHHDGFCLWDTKTTTLNVMNSPLRRDVLAVLRKSCDKYGLKLALYFSEGDWRMDRKKTTVTEQAALKKAQLKELLTNYGPVEFISFDHAQGTGGLNHRDTDQWVREFQPDCFSGFNNGEAGGRISLRERGTPGPIGQATAMANQMANEQSFAFTVAEFNYPINLKYWFFNTGAPEHPNLPAAKIYADYCGAVKYSNIFSLDVGPNLEGKLRDMDVKTLRQVGAMIKNPPPAPASQGQPAKASCAGDAGLGRADNSKETVAQPWWHTTPSLRTKRDFVRKLADACHRQAMPLVIWRKSQSVQGLEITLVKNARILPSH